MTPEERFERIEKTLEHLADADVRVRANLEELQDFMRDSAQRFEERLERTDERLDRLAEHVTEMTRDVRSIAGAIVTLTDLFGRHLREGHGRNGKEPDKS